MGDRPEGFLPMKTALSCGDKAILSPVYLFGANVMLRGIFFGLKLTPVTVAVDAASGRTSLLEKAPEILSRLELPSECRRLEAKLSRATAEAFAEEAAVPDNARGWRRGITSAKILFRPGECGFVWRVYILRGNSLIDSFSGEAADASGVVDLLLGQRQNEAGPAEL